MVEILKIPFIFYLRKPILIIITLLVNKTFPLFIRHLPNKFTWSNGFHFINRTTLIIHEIKQTFWIQQIPILCSRITYFSKIWVLILNIWLTNTCHCFITILIIISSCFCIYWYPCSRFQQLIKLFFIHLAFSFKFHWFPI